MQGRERQVARFGHPDGHLHGLQVAHFADENDVGVFAQDGAEGVGIGQRVGEQFALIDQRILGGEKIFDGVLDRDDVDGPLGVDVLDHAGQGRRFAAAGGPGDEDESAGQIAELGDAGRYAQFLEAPHRRQKTSDGRGHRAFLHEDIGPETAEIAQAEGEIQFQLFLELLFLLVGQQAVDELFRVGRRQGGVIDGLEDAMDADARRDVSRDVEVGSVLVDGDLEEILDGQRHARSPSPGRFPGPLRQSR